MTEQLKEKKGTHPVPLNQLEADLEWLKDTEMSPAPAEIKVKHLSDFATKADYYQHLSEYHHQRYCELSQQCRQAMMAEDISQLKRIHHSILLISANIKPSPHKVLEKWRAQQEDPTSTVWQDYVTSLEWKSTAIHNYKQMLKQISRFSKLLEQEHRIHKIKQQWQQGASD